MEGRSRVTFYECLLQLLVAYMVLEQLEPGSEASEFQPVATCFAITKLSCGL